VVNNDDVAIIMDTLLTMQSSLTFQKELDFASRKLMTACMRNIQHPISSIKSNNIVSKVKDQIKRVDQARKLQQYILEL